MRRFIIIVLISFISIVTAFSDGEQRKKQIRINSVTSGDGMPIIMLHGFGVDHRQLKGCMEPLFEKRTGWKRIYIDLPGMGKSEGKEWIRSSDKILQLVSAFIHNTVKDDRFVIVGHSYGAYIARAFALEASKTLEGMLLIAPLTIPETSKRKLPEKTVLISQKELGKDVPAEDIALFRSLAVIQTKPVWERFKEDILPGMKGVNPEFLLNLRAKGYALSYNVNNAFIRFEKPALIITGRQDHLVGFSDQLVLIDYFPHATFAVLNGAGPLLQIEQEEVFNLLATKFLDEIEKTWAENPPELEEKADDTIKVK